MTQKRKKLINYSTQTSAEGGGQGGEGAQEKCTRDDWEEGGNGEGGGEIAL